ncbi:unnamed protein product, partial [Pleuronectes platessa]
AISLDNQLVVLGSTALDAGRYHVEAVNELTGENVTSAAVYLSISEPDFKPGAVDETIEPVMSRLHVRTEDQIQLFPVVQS